MRYRAYGNCGEDITPTRAELDAEERTSRFPTARPDNRPEPGESPPWDTWPPRPGQRTCANGSPGQVKFITDLTREIHTARTAQINAAHAAHGQHGKWDASTVATLIETLGTVEDVVRTQLAAPLVYTDNRTGTVGTIDTLKATLQRERTMLRAMQARNTATPVAGNTARKIVVDTLQHYV
jgi:hypothetical protein